MLLTAVAVLLQGLDCVILCMLLLQSLDCVILGILLLQGLTWLRHLGHVVAGPYLIAPSWAYSCCTALIDCSSWACCCCRALLDCDHRPGTSWDTQRAHNMEGDGNTSAFIYKDNIPSKRATGTCYWWLHRRYRKLIVSNHCPVYILVHC